MRVRATGKTLGPQWTLDILFILIEETESERLLQECNMAIAQNKNWNEKCPQSCSMCVCFCWSVCLPMGSVVGQKETFMIVERKEQNCSRPESGSRLRRENANWGNSGNEKVRHSYWYYRDKLREDLRSWRYEMETLVKKKHPGNGNGTPREDQT